MKNKIEELKTFAEKAEYSHKCVEESNIKELRDGILNIFMKIRSDTQDDRIFLNCLMGEINQWIWVTKKLTGHKYSCFLPRVIDVIPKVDDAMGNKKDIGKEFKKLKEKIDKLDY